MKVFVSGADEAQLKELNRHGFKAITPECQLPNKQNIAIDLQQLNRVDAVLIFGKPTWENCGHFWYTAFITKRLTIIVGENTESFESWFSTEIVDTLDDAIKILTTWKRKL